MERVDELKREIVINGLKLLQDHCHVQKNCHGCICEDICKEIKEATFEWALPNPKEIRSMS